MPDSTDSSMAITTLSDQILEIAGDAIFLIERNGTIVRANKTANRMMTESGSGIRTGQPFWEFLNDLSGDDWDAIVKPLNISGPVSMRDTVSSAH
jgi:PAS domain-containing protein